MNYRYLIYLLVFITFLAHAQKPLVIEGDLFIPDLEDKPWPQWVPKISDSTSVRQARHEDYFMEYLTPGVPQHGYNLLYERWLQQKNLGTESSESREGR